jgi:hypothetical protein
VVFVGTFKAGKQLTAIEDGKLVILPGTLFALADVVIEYGACACLLHPLTAQFGTTRTSGDVRLESEKRSKADIEQTLLNDRVRPICDISAQFLL